jgi:hypothetical protein
MTFQPIVAGAGEVLARAIGVSIGTDSARGARYRSVTFCAANLARWRAARSARA